MRAALVLLVVLSGCSLAFTNAPKAEEPDKPCNDSEASPIADAAIAIVYGVGLVVAVSQMTEPYPDSEAQGLAIGSGLGAAIFGASAIYGFTNIGKCRRHNKELYEDSLRSQQGAEPPASRRDAWQLTKQAAAAARGGDCETTAALEQVVRGLDAEFHRTVFMRDAAIIQCTASREIPIEPPSATPATP